jgi:hypothetical protein
VLCNTYSGTRGRVEARSDTWPELLLLLYFNSFLRLVNGPGGTGDPKGQASRLLLKNEYQVPSEGPQTAADDAAAAAVASRMELPS